MKSICVSCNYIGQLEKGRQCDHLATAVYFMIAALFALFGYYYPLLFIGTYFFVLRGILAISCCYENMSKCPKCNTKNLLPSNFLNKYISEMKLDMTNSKFVSSGLDVSRYLKFKEVKICTFCNYIGLTWEQQNFSLVMGVLFVIAGLLFISIATINAFLIIGSFIFVIIGILIILASISDAKKCPKCEYKSLIPIDSRGGKFILEEKSINFSTPIRSSRIPTISYDNGIFYTAFILILATYIYYRLFLYFNSLN